MFIVTHSPAGFHNVSCFFLAIFPHFCLLFLSYRTMWSLVCIPPARPHGCLLSSRSWPPCTRARTLPWASSLKSRSICRSGNRGHITTWKPDPLLFKDKAGKTNELCAVWTASVAGRYTETFVILLCNSHWNFFKVWCSHPWTYEHARRRCVLSHTLIQLLSDKSRRVILQDRCYFVFLICV